MKIFLLLSFLVGCLITSAGLLNAQTLTPATLYKLDRSASKTKIKKVTLTDVYYVELASPNKPRTISKKELWKIVYQDGRSVVLNAPKSEMITSFSVPTSESLTTRSVPIITVAEMPKPVSTPQQAASIQDRPLVEAEGAHSIIKYAPLSSFGYEHVLSNSHSL